MSRWRPPRSAVSYHTHDQRLDLGARPLILVIKLATAGDLLLSMPALRALRSRYPDAQLDVLTTPASASLLAESPLVNHVYALDKYRFDYLHQMLRAPWRLLAPLPLLARLRARRYDVVVLAHHLTLRFGVLKSRLLLAGLGARHTVGLDNGRGRFLDLRVRDEGFGARHEADYALALAAALDAELPAPARALRLTDLGWVDSRQDDDEAAVPAAPLIALHPGGGGYSVARRWPAERFAELAMALHGELAARIVLVGGADERELHQHILDLLGAPSWAHSTSGATSPRELAGLLRRCQLLVANDSFPMHLAVAAGVPVVALFGPTNVRAWGPYAPNPPDAAVVLWRADLPCSPCMYRGHDLGTPQGCPERPCLMELRTPQVLQAARRLLRQTAASPAG